ncbi:17857_t:CDS:1, partial [Funneliformis geosporum]
QKKKNTMDDKLLKDIKKWSPDHVKKFFKSRMKDLDFNETDVKKFIIKTLLAERFFD